MRQVRRTVLLLCMAALGFAQDRGTVRGTVGDPSGASVPDAVVTARNVDTGLTQSARTGPDGVYNIVYLPVGSYTVTTEKPGFRKAEATNVRVGVNTVANVDVTLTVGTVDQTDFSRGVHVTDKHGSRFLDGAERMRTIVYQESELNG